MPNKRVTAGGGSSVMANRAKGSVETDDPQAALHRTLDFFPSPPWSTRAGAEILADLDGHPDVSIDIREPACGQGHMSEVLRERFVVGASDVHDHGKGFAVRDWLDDAAWPAEPDCDWIVTNPPFAIADQFVIRGLQRARRGVALLLRLAFMEGGERHAILAGGKASLTLLAPFSERVPMTLGKWQTDAASATAYAWFFWMKGAEPMAPRWIGPGSRARLWAHDDAERYGWRAPLPLFGEDA